MSELAQVVVRRDRASVRVAVTGEIDVSNAEQIRAALDAAINPPLLTVDLSGLAYIDSAGIRALFAVAEAATTRRTELRLVIGETSPIRRVLDVAGVASVAAVDVADRA